MLKLREHVELDGFMSVSVKYYNYIFTHHLNFEKQPKDTAVQLCNNKLLNVGEGQDKKLKKSSANNLQLHH